MYMFFSTGEFASERVFSSFVQQWDSASRLQSPDGLWCLSNFQLRSNALYDSRYHYITPVSLVVATQLYKNIPFTIWFICRRHREENTLKDTWTLAICVMQDISTLLFAKKPSVFLIEVMLSWLCVCLWGTRCLVIIIWSLKNTLSERKEKPAHTKKRVSKKSCCFWFIKLCVSRWPWRDVTLPLINNHFESPTVAV